MGVQFSVRLMAQRKHEPGPPMTLGNIASESASADRSALILIEIKDVSPARRGGHRRWGEREFP